MTQKNSLKIKLQYDNIYHEHLYYYSLNALNNLFSQFDMTIIGFEEIPIHAGSIRVIVENDKIECPLNVSKRLKEEEKWGLTSIDWLEDFGDKVRTHISTIKTIKTNVLFLVVKIELGIYFDHQKIKIFV